MVLTALLRTHAADSVQGIAVAGDTSYDMRSARRSGAALAAGVLTGAHDEPRPARRRATHVLGSVAELPDVIAAYERTAAVAGDR